MSKDGQSRAATQSSYSSFTMNRIKTYKTQWFASLPSQVGVQYKFTTPNFILIKPLEVISCELGLSFDLPKELYLKFNASRELLEKSVIMLDDGYVDHTKSKNVKFDFKNLSTKIVSISRGSNIASTTVHTSVDADFVHCGEKPATL